MTALAGGAGHGRRGDHLVVVQEPQARSVADW